MPDPSPDQPRMSVPEAEAALAPLEAAVRAGRETQQRSRTARFLDALTHSGPGYDLTPEPTDQAAVRAGREAQQTGDPTAAPTVWVDGHPQLETIAAAVWEQCRTEGTSLVVDDPRNIAVVALSAVLSEPTDQAASPVCICGHPEVRHFEDVCLTCGCGDYLEPQDAAAVIDRWRQAALNVRAGERAAALQEAALHLYTALFPAVYNDLGQKAAEGVNRAVSELRRLADEQPTTPTADLPTLAAALDGLGTLIATSSRDWGEYRIDAWLYAVLLGWDCEDTEHNATCVHGAMDEMQARHGWSDEAVAKARRYRAAVRALTEPAGPAAPAKDTQPDDVWTVKDSTRHYAEKLRATPGTVVADGHTGWECVAGAQLLVSATTPGPGALGTHHGTIYACPSHQAAAVDRISGAGYEADPRPAPPGHRWNPWPCGHVTAHGKTALTTLTAEAPTAPRPSLRERHRAAWTALTPAERDARLAALDAIDADEQPTAEPGQDTAIDEQ